MGKVRFVWSPLPICNMFLSQTSSFETEYLNGTVPDIQSDLSQVFEVDDILIL